MAATARSGGSSVPSLPPPCPKSPPEYPDLYGKRRESAKVQMLEREISFLEEELKSVEGLQPASKYCKEVTDFVMAKSDPLIPTSRKNRKSCRFWKWLCGMPCFNLICCCSRVNAGPATAACLTAVHANAEHVNAAHVIAVHVTALHVNAVHATALHVNAVHATALHVNAVHATALHVNAVHATALHVNAVHATALHATALHVNAVHATALHVNAVHATALHVNAVHATAIHV
ncbi:hypothetical protein PTKIN_Ptkin19aG0088300 [Pterospermum kingtungense]